LNHLSRQNGIKGIPNNNLCPSVGGSKTPTGCVATAMAQIMKYHNHPVSGIGQSEAYTTWSGISVPPVDFEINYDWATMLDSYYGGENQQQQEAVATLMYHCGASIKMDYNTDGSGAYNYNMIVALIYNFGYN